MSTPTPLEQRILAGADDLLSAATREYQGDNAHGVRLELLEAAASRLGGFDLGDYHSLSGRSPSVELTEALALADSLLETLRQTPIHPSLALASLARPPLRDSEKRTKGAYYTDFRLAQMLVEHLPSSELLTVIDPAAGSGILLVATALKLCGRNRAARAEFLENYVSAADLSGVALRGTALALASLTDDLDAVKGMCPRLRQMDSLLVGGVGWEDVAPEGFDAVIGNPPWEKLKVNKHEFMAAKGEDRHYGHDYALEAEATRKLDLEREKVAAYANEATLDLDLQGRGEPDLYKLFLELSYRLVKARGHVLLLLPAGLIRSQGTEDLRAFLVESASDLDLTVLENRARFFAIDTRFKFLVVHATIDPDKRRSPIVLRHREGTDTGVAPGAKVRLGRSSLSQVRPDLSLPEVRSAKEWSIFRRMTKAGERIGDPDGQWQPSITREIDMSRDRDLFHRDGGNGRLPIVEGRMVHQHRFGAKAYVSGTGRRAIWDALPPGQEAVRPQFWVHKSDVQQKLLLRIQRDRFGFCDVTGQTNERSLLAARIPAGVVSGNKVPTVVFGGEGASSSHRMALGYLWLALANSFAVDWYLRRVVTTSLNYFILRSLPLPTLDPNGLPGRRLATLSRELAGSADTPDLWRTAAYRAEIDALAFAAFGLDLSDATAILDDFPLLDRGQPALVGEDSSTVTRDLVLRHVARLNNIDTDPYEERVLLARKAGAVPYIPGEFSSVLPESTEEAKYG